MKGALSPTPRPAEGSADRLRELEARLAAVHGASHRAELLGALLDAFDNTLVVTDPGKPDNPIIYVNRGFEELTGYRPEEVVGRNCRFLQGLDRDQPAVARLREAVRAGEAVQVELRNYRKDGSMFYNELYLSPIMDDEGRPMLFLGVQNDVTERVEALRELKKARDILETRVRERTQALHTSNESLEHEVVERRRAEREVRASEERLHDVLDHLLTFVAVLDPDGRLEYVNHTALSVSEVTLDEVLGEPFADTPWWRHDPAVQARLRGALQRAAEGETLRYDERVWVGEGRVLTVDFMLAPMTDEEGRVTHLAASAVDITERKEAEGALRESQRFLRSTLDALSAHIAVLDEEGTIVATNAAWRRFARENGGNPDDVGTNYLTVCGVPPAKDADEDEGGARNTPKNSTDAAEDNEGADVAAGIQAVIGGEREQFRLEYPCHSPTERRWFALTVSRFSGPGPVRVVVAHENISERKLAEEALQGATERHRLLVESAKEYAIIMTDSQGRVLEWNPGAERIIGYAEEDVLGQKVDFIFTPEDREEGRPAFELRQAEATGAANAQRWHLRKDGTRFFADGVMTALRDDEGRLRGFAKVLRDSTERRKAEEALQRSEERLRLALETVRLGDWELDLSTLEAQRSLRHDQIFGYDTLLPEWSYDRFLEHVLPEDRAHVAKKFGASLAEGVPWDFECRIAPRGGGTRWIWARGKAYRDAAGKPVRVLGTVMDVTERKEAEAALRESEVRFRGTFENAAVGIAHVGMGGEWLRVNETLCRITGYSKDELLRMTIQDITHPDDLNADLVQIERLMKGEIESYTMEKRYFHRDGRVVWMDLTAALQRGEDGEPRYCISVVEDISERKEAERERLRLLELERSAREDAERAGARLSFLAEASTLLASSLDYEETLANVAKLAVPGVADWCTVDLVDEGGRLERLAVAHKDPDKVAWALELNRRYPPLPETSGGFYEVLRTGKAVLRPDVPDALLAAAAHDDAHLKLLRDVGFRSMMVVPLNVHDKTLGVLLFVSAEGGRRYTKVDLALAEELGRRAAIAMENAVLYAQAQDLNEALEERVAQRTAQLESANKELEAFSYSVSHDLRAPLRGIDGFSQALLEDYGEGLDETARHYLARVRAGAQRMGELIDDLLLLSRLSRSEMKRQEVDVSGMVEEIAERLAEREPEREATFSVEENVMAEGDARLLTVVLENLLENAWKFTSHERCALIRFGVQGGEIPVYFIQDNGAGFNMAYANKLFAAFQRLHSPHEFEGTGIGLATVQRIVHRHGGRVWAEGEVGVGATFFFTLA